LEKKKKKSKSRGPSNHFDQIKVVAARQSQ
jgi:hypothetical protein